MKPLLPLLLCSLVLWDSYRATSKHWIILVSPHFSTFANLILGHLKVLKYLSFSLLLYFCESCSSQALPLSSGQSGARPETRATWHLVIVFSPSSLSLYLFHSSLVYIIFLDTHTNPGGHVSCLLIAHGYASFYHSTHTIYIAFWQGNNQLCLL